MAWRKLLIWLGAALGALIAVALILPVLIDVDDYRGDIAELAGERLGREVTIDGPLTLSLLPNVRLHGEAITVANKSGPGFSDRPMARLEAIDAELALLPLLSGRAEVARFALVGPDILLERNEAGEVNWQFDAMEQAAAAPAAAGAETDAAKLSAESIAVKGGRAFYRDASRQTQIKAIEADLKLDSLQGPFSGSLAFAYAGTRYAMDGMLGRLDSANVPLELAGRLRGKPLRFVGSLVPDPEVLELAGALDYGASRAEIDLTGDFSQGQSLAGEIEVANLDLADFETGAESDESAGAAFDGGLPLALPAEVDARLRLAVAEIANAPMAAGPVRMEARLSEGILHVETLEASFAQSARLSASGRIESSGGFADAAFDTQLEMPDFRGIFDLPEHMPRRLDMRARASLSGAQMGLFELDAKLGESRIRGRVGTVLAGTSQLAAELSIDRLDLADYLPESESRTQSGDAGKPPAFPALADLDGGFLLTVERLDYDGRQLGPAALEARLAHGRLAIDRLDFGRAEAFRVSVEGTLQDLATRPVYDLSVSAESGDLERAFALAGAKAPPALAEVGALTAAGRLEGSFEDADFNLDGRLGGLDFTAQVCAEKLLSDAPALTGDVSGRHRSLAALAGEVGVTGLPAGAEAKPAEITASLSQGTAGLQVSGRLAAGTARIGFELEPAEGGRKTALNLQSADLRQALRDLGVDYRPAQTDLGPLNLRIEADLRDETLEIAPVSGQVGPVTLQGNGRADLSGSVASVTLALDAGDVPLDELLPKSKTGVEAASAETGERWSDAEIDLAALGAVDGRLELTAGSLTLADYRFEAARLAAESRGKNLEITELSGELFGGRAQIAASLKGTGTPELATEIALEDVDLDRLMETTIDSRPASGTAFFNGQFHGAGHSQKAIVSSLTGSGHLGADGGVIRKIDLVALNRRIKTLSTLADFARVTATTLGGGQTAYRHAGFDVVAENGQLRTRDFMADVDGAEVDFTGELDLPAWTVDSRAAFALAEHPNAPPVGAVIRGPLSAPRVDYRTDRLKQWAAGRLGLAVGRAVSGGEGMSPADLLFGGQAPDSAQESGATRQSSSQQQSAEQESSRSSGDSVGETLMRGLFGGGRRRAQEGEDETAQEDSGGDPP